MGATGGVSGFGVPMGANVAAAAAAASAGTTPIRARRLPAHAQTPTLSIMTSFTELTTPRAERGASSVTSATADGAVMDTEPPIVRSSAGKGSMSEARNHHHVQFASHRSSEASNRVMRSEVGRSMIGHAYKPSVKERARVVLEGRSGLYLELVNLLGSCIIFAIYVAELYHRDLYDSTVVRTVELVITTFFIFDLALHLVADAHPWRYLISTQGIIDVLTIIPSLIVYFVPDTRSQMFFILRVLRIFRALRVLRLKQLVKFKKRGFDYELSVFMLSSVAVILCAAGMFQALEEQHYQDKHSDMSFHDSLYFVLVTISTVGYGDITPQTDLGHVFVMLLIISVFTFVPRQLSKLNELAKHNFPYNKSYEPKNNASGHVVVAGQDLTFDYISDFLLEFFHSTRGDIHLDVVFMCNTPPSTRIKRLLETEKYRLRTCYLRGSLNSYADRERARLRAASAAFVVSNRRLHTKATQQDATTVLQALSVRNYADAISKRIDLYVQLLSTSDEYEMASCYLGANVTKISDLKNLVLARAALCPGASTLILNMLFSIRADEYDKYRMREKPWVDEYMHGMGHQLFPIIFTQSFHEEKFEDVSRHLYERFGAILVGVKRSSSHRRSHHSHEDDITLLAPFRTRIKEGDIGFLLTTDANAVHHIVSTYGSWNGFESSEPVPTSIRVSSDSLFRRQSPRSLFRTRGRSPAFRDIPVVNEMEHADSESEEKDVVELHLSAAVDKQLIRSRSLSSPLASPNRTSLPSPVVHSNAKQAASTSTALWKAVVNRSSCDAQVCLERDHIRRHTKNFSDHYVLCGGTFREILGVAHHIRYFRHWEAELAHANVVDTPESPSQQKQSQQHRPTRQFVLLVERLPTVDDVLNLVDVYEHDVFQNVYFVCGRAIKHLDLQRVGLPRAHQVVIVSTLHTIDNAPTMDVDAYESSQDKRDEESVVDVGVVTALLSVELARKEPPHGATTAFGRTSSMRRLNSHRLTSDAATPHAHPISFQRELEQGLPAESIKLRMIDRFPEIDRSLFRETHEVIEAVVQRYDSQLGMPSTGFGATSGSNGSSVGDINVLAVLNYAQSAQYCRPRDQVFSHDKMPYLTPAYASGRVFLASVLNRAVCQAFYNPYITDVVQALSMGTGEHYLPTDRRKGAHRYRRLFQVPVHVTYAGGHFIEAFMDYLTLEMLVVGVLRSPNIALENLLPYVVTCPLSDMILHSTDRLFVIG